MPLVPLPRAWQPNDIIPAQWANNVGLDVQLLDTRTGGDPGASGRFLVATGLASGGWRLLQQGDFGPTIIPSSAMIDRKVNTLNPNYPSFAAALAGGSHFFDVSSAPDGPTASSFMAMQSRSWNYGAGDYHFVIAADLYNIRELYVQGVVGGTPSPWYKLFHSGNGGVSSGIDADKLQGKTPGHATGQIPFNDGVLNPNLNAGLFGGQAPAYYATAAQVAANTPIGIIVIWPYANTAIPVGWVQETNLNGRFPAGVGAATNTVGLFGGAAVHKHSINHSHPNTNSDGSDRASTKVAAGTVDVAHFGHLHNVVTPSTTADSADMSTMPPYWAVYYIRKT